MDVKNIIYIHTHDSGIYFQPYIPEIATPHLDAFSKDALVFEEAYCTSPTCSPSRASLLTGRYPHTNGMIGLGNRCFALQDYQQHLVQRLNHQGYQTVLCGIQHEYARYKDHAAGAAMIGYQQDITTDCEDFEDKELLKWDVQNTIALCDWLQSYDQKKPFFASMGFFSTHREYPDITMSEEALLKLKLPDFLEDSLEIRADWAGHLQSVKAFDDNFGKLMQTLQDTGLYDSTLVLFTTDHGIPYPYAKCTLYDAGIHVALMMRYPHAPSNGKRYQGLISHVDVAPTICDLLGIKKDSGYEGISFQEVFYDIDKTIRGSVFAEVNFHTSYEPVRCIRNEHYKLIRYYDSYAYTNLSNIDNSPTKAYYQSHQLLNHVKQGVALYDVSKDPLEQHDLAKQEAYFNIVEELSEQLSSWQTQTYDKVPLKRSCWKRTWVVNKPSCSDPKSKLEEDFIQ